MTPNEIYRSAYEVAQEAADGDAPASKRGAISERSARLCPSCKSDTPDTVTDPVELAPFRDFYQRLAKKFIALRCSFCSAKWSIFWRAK